MNARIKNMPRPESFKRFSGARGSGISSGRKPFPSSLMIACVGVAEDDAITLDTNELEDAMWVPREMVRAVLAGEAGPFLPPPPYAIAHTLLTVWAAEPAAG